MQHLFQPHLRFSNLNYLSEAAEQLVKFWKESLQKKSLKSKTNEAEERDLLIQIELTFKD